MSHSAGTQSAVPNKLWNKSFILVLLLSICNQSASQMVTPLISKYAISMGAALTVAATISGTMSIVALFLRPVSGFCSDRFNRKIIIICTSITTALCMYVYSVANSLPLLIATRIAHGVVFSFSGVAIMSFNTSFIPRERMGEGMGWMSMSSIVSQAFGPNIGMWLVDNYGYSVCFIVAMVASLLSTTILLAVPYKHTPPAAPSKGIDLNSLISLRILPYAAVMALFSCGNGLVTTFIALIGDERGIANIGLFFTAYSFAMVATRPFVGKFLDKKGLKLILYPSLVIAGLSMVLLGYAQALWVVIVAGVLKAFGQGSGSPSIQATCMKQLGKEKAGVVSSTCYIGMDIGNAVAPVLGGMVVDKFGYSNMFLGYAFLLILGGSVIFYFKAKFDEKKYGVRV